jgi:glycosyltransferase involved in cell wall biosynthesis
MIIINNLPNTSGIGRYATSLYSFAKKSHDNIELLNLSSKLDGVSIIMQGKNTTSILGVCAKSLIQYLKMLEYRLILKRFMRVKGENHLIHYVNPYLCLLHKFTSPYVITVHDIPYSFLNEISSIHAKIVLSIYETQLRKFIQNASRVICTSKNTYLLLSHFVNVDPKKVRVIYYGVDHELFKPRDKLEARRRLGLPLDKPIISNVGSEEPRKNIPTLIKAFGILVKDVPNAMLIRVGSPTNTIKKLIHSEELEGKIVYLRPTDEDLSLLYNASDVFVFPSYYEGLGLPLLEAMASGCPVIAGNRSAIPEAVGDGGILLDPFDVDGFAYWMREVLSNEDLRIKLSEEGYRRSMNFSWEKCARETLEVYREVLNKL